MWDSAFWNKTWSRKYERYNRHHREIWNVILPYLRGNVVDLGCGACVMYEGQTVSLVGIDWSEEGLKQARIHYPYGTYICADASSTGLPSGQFDTIIMLGLLDYFDNWDEVVSEARRLRRDGGRILATLLQGFESHDWTIEKVKEKLNGDPKQYRHVTGNWFLIEI